MAIPPEMLKQFQSQPGLPPEVQALDSAAAGALTLPEEGAQYEDTLVNGWGYRKYADGKVKIIVAPEGHKAGQVLDAGPAYDAILMEIESAKPPPPPSLPPTTTPGARIDPMTEAVAGLRKKGGLVGPDGVDMGPPVFPAR